MCDDGKRRGNAGGGDRATARPRPRTRTRATLGARALSQGRGGRVRGEAGVVGHRPPSRRLTGLATPESRQDLTWRYDRRH